MVKVSVVMPLFNAERYLPEALDCVLKQTMGDFELICINACSTDNTEKILDEYCGRDKRIQVIKNKKRLGAGLSRNRGIRQAHGKYMMFLDGDDVFDRHMLEKAGAAMDRYGVDIVLFEAVYHVPCEIIYMERDIERPEEFRKKYCEAPFSKHDFKPEEFPNSSDSPCDKMFSRKFIVDNQLEFQDLPSANDVYFAKMAMLCAQKIIWLNDKRALLHSREHNEPSRISKDRNPMCAYLALEKFASEVKKRGMMPQTAEYVYYTVRSELFYLLNTERNEERKKDFYCFLHDEGIEKLTAYGGEYYASADRYVRYLIEGFREYPYERGWFQNPDSFFRCCLHHDGDAVCAFVRGKLSRGERIILWGAGVNGKILLNYFEKNSIQISGVVDRDASKQGTYAGEYQIEGPMEHIRKADCVLFTSEQVYLEAAQTIEEKGASAVKVMDLMNEGRVAV